MSLFPPKLNSPDKATTAPDRPACPLCCMIALCALLTSAHTRQPQARLSDGTVDWHHQRDGMECFETCGKKAGTCMNFCGVEKAWWGGCCMANATGNLSAPECENRGCVGHHCCVSTDIKRGTTDQQPQAEQARAHAQQAAAQALTPSQPASTEEEGAMCPGHRSQLHEFVITVARSHLTQKGLQ